MHICLLEPLFYSVNFALILFLSSAFEKALSVSGCRSLAIFRINEEIFDYFDDYCLLL